MSRAVLVGVLTASIVIVTALFAGLGFRAWRTGHVDYALLVQLGFVFLGLLIVIQLVLRPPRARHEGPFCRCGARLFPTRRTGDGERLWTCFACGAETVRPPPRVRPGRPRRAEPSRGA